MRSGKLKIGMLVLAVVLTGCAVGDLYQDVKKDIPPIAANMSRIFIYRVNDPYLAIATRQFVLDGKPIADVLYGTSFYYDTTPGTHRIKFNNPPQTLRITIPPGQTIYLEYFTIAADNTDKSTSIRMVSRERAEREMVNTVLVEAKIRKFEERAE